MHGRLLTTKHMQHSPFISSMKGHLCRCCLISSKLQNPIPARISRLRLLKCLRSLELAIRYGRNYSDRSNTYLYFAQILGVTADNASNNDTMIEHLATLIESFLGAANQTWCFTHILNLVAKSVLHQFEAPKSKEGKVLDDAARTLAGIFDDLEDDDVDLDGDVDVDGAGNEGNEDGSEGNDDVDGDVADDDEDGLPDERDGMSEEELAKLEESVKPVRLVLTKVCQFKLLFKNTFRTDFEQLRGLSLAIKNSSTIILP
jgi:hypothetical protein